MHLRRAVAAAIAVAALALLAVALLPAPRLHAFLSAGAGHSVTWGYADDFRFRAVVCSIVAFVIAVGTLYVNLERYPIPVLRPLSPVPVLIIAIGAIARAALLFVPPRYDEVFTVIEFTGHSPPYFLTRYIFANNHVFHTLLVWGVRQLAGDRMWALRLPAFAAGIALLFATYTLGRRLAGEHAALVATAVAAVASPLVEYSAQARGYTILTLAFLLLYLLEDELAAAAALALGAWTIPTMLYAAAAWVLWTIVARRNWQRVLRVGLAGGAMAFLLYLPMLVASGVATMTENGVTRSLGWAAFRRQLPTMLAETAASWSLSFTIPLAIALALAALMAIVLRKPAALPFVCAVVAIVAMLVVTRRVPFARVWIVLLPLFALAAASVVPRLPKIIIVIAAAILAANAVRVAHRSDFYEDPAMLDVPEVAGTIRALPAEARVLVTSPLDASYRFYAPGRVVEFRFDTDPAVARAAIAAAPRRYFVASDRPHGSGMYRQLRLPYQLVPVARFPHTVLFELRSPP